MNENFKLVLQEAGYPAFKQISNFVNQVVTAFTEKVPFDELFT
jgi:hypothetical protein